MIFGGGLDESDLHSKVKKIRNSENVTILGTIALAV